MIPLLSQNSLQRILQGKEQLNLQNREEYYPKDICESLYEALIYEVEFKLFEYLKKQYSVLHTKFNPQDPTNNLKYLKEQQIFQLFQKNSIKSNITSFFRKSSSKTNFQTLLKQQNAINMDSTNLKPSAFKISKWNIVRINLKNIIRLGKSLQVQENLAYSKKIKQQDFLKSCFLIEDFIDKYGYYNKEKLGNVYRTQILERQEAGLGKSVPVKLSKTIQLMDGSESYYEDGIQNSQKMVKRKSSNKTQIQKSKYRTNPFLDLSNASDEGYYNQQEQHSDIQQSQDIHASLTKDKYDNYLKPTGNFLQEELHQARPSLFKGNHFQKNLDEICDEEMEQKRKKWFKLLTLEQKQELERLKNKDKERQCGISRETCGKCKIF